MQQESGQFEQALVRGLNQANVTIDEAPTDEEASALAVADNGSLGKTSRCPGDVTTGKLTKSRRTAPWSAIVAMGRESSVNGHVSSKSTTPELA